MDRCSLQLPSGFPGKEHSGQVASCLPGLPGSSARGSQNHADYHLLSLSEVSEGARESVAKFSKGTTKTSILLDWVWGGNPRVSLGSIFGCVCADMRL